MVRLYRTFSNYISSGDNMHRFGEVQAHRTSSNLLDTHPHKDSKVYRLLSHEFRVVRLYRTSSNYISSGDTRCAGCNMHRFGEVQAHRTSLNLLELHPHRDKKVYRVLIHEFGVVRLYRTFYISSSSNCRES